MPLLYVLFAQLLLAASYAEIFQPAYIVDQDTIYPVELANLAH